jgi:hypothetical protein
MGCTSFVMNNTRAPCQGLAVCQMDGRVRAWAWLAWPLVAPGAAVRVGQPWLRGGRIVHNTTFTTSVKNTTITQNGQTGEIANARGDFTMLRPLDV